MDRDGDGEVTFEAFVDEVVRIQNTNAGPVSAVLQHQVSQVLEKIEDLRTDVNVNKPVFKPLSQDASSAAMAQESSVAIVQECRRLTDEVSKWRSDTHHSVDNASPAVMKELLELKSQFSTFCKGMMEKMTLWSPSIPDGAAPNAVEQRLRAEARLESFLMADVPPVPKADRVKGEVEQEYRYLESPEAPQSSKSAPLKTARNDVIDATSSLTPSWGTRSFAGVQLDV